MSWKKLFEPKPPKNPIRSAQAEIIRDVLVIALFLYVGLMLWSANGDAEMKNAIGIDLYSQVATTMTLIITLLKVPDLMNGVYNWYKLKKSGEIKP